MTVAGSKIDNSKFYYCKNLKTLIAVHIAVTSQNKAVVLAG
jgi:hypothetical protein